MELRGIAFKAKGQRPVESAVNYENSWKIPIFKVSIEIPNLILR